MRARGDDPGAGFGALFDHGAAGPGVDEHADLLERLHRAEQDKILLERQLESANANWRSERERLLAEVEQSRRAVERMRTQAGDIERSHLQHREADRLSRELELRCQTQTAELQTMRQRFEGRIAELEQQLVEMMDRSSNTHRRAQAADNRLETELASARRAIEIDWQRRMQSVQEAWFKERRVLEREIERLKKAPSSEPRISSPRPDSRWIDRFRG